MTILDFPDRLRRPLTTAEDIAICVRSMKNLQDAAALIDLYAQSVAAGARCEQHRESSNTVLRAIDPRLDQIKPVDIIFGGGDAKA